VLGFLRAPILMYVYAEVRYAIVINARAPGAASRKICMAFLIDCPTHAESLGDHCDTIACIQQLGGGELAVCRLCLLPCCASGRARSELGSECGRMVSEVCKVLERETLRAAARIYSCGLRNLTTDPHRSLNTNNQPCSSWLVLFYNSLAITREKFLPPFQLFEICAIFAAIVIF
jgi:hypothetical protein